MSTEEYGLETVTCAHCDARGYRDGIFVYLQHNEGCTGLGRPS
jgi:hypothetical protein